MTCFKMIPQESLHSTDLHRGLIKWSSKKDVMFSTSTQDCFSQKPANLSHKTCWSIKENIDHLPLYKLSDTNWVSLEGQKQGTYLYLEKLMMALKLLIVRLLSGLKMSIMEKSETPVTAINLTIARMDARFPTDSSCSSGYSRFPMVWNAGCCSSSLSTTVIKTLQRQFIYTSSLLQREEIERILTTLQGTSITILHNMHTWNIMLHNHIEMDEMVTQVDVLKSNRVIIWTPVFEWYVARCTSKSGHQKDMCIREIGLRAQIIATILGSGLLVNIIGGRGNYMTI